MNDTLPPGWSHFSGQQHRSCRLCRNDIWRETFVLSPTGSSYHRACAPKTRAWKKSLARQKRLREAPWEQYLPLSPSLYISIQDWGEDHWSTLAYLETCAVDKKGAIDNLRMRCNPRLHRNFSGIMHGQIIDGSAFHTRAKFRKLPDHDDWSCAEDMSSYGLLNIYWRKMREEMFGDCDARVEFTPAGIELASRLRQHLASGGSFRDFSPSTTETQQGPSDRLSRP